jgi:hypothetical protein
MIYKKAKILCIPQTAPQKLTAGGMPAPHASALRAPIRRLRGELSERRRTLAAGWAAVEAERTEAPPPLSDLLPAEPGALLMSAAELHAADAEEREAHAERMAEIRRAHTAASAALERTRALASMLRTTVYRGGARTPALASVREGAIDAKRELMKELTAQADEAEASVARARQRLSVPDLAADRRAALAAGAPMHQWDEGTRTLRPCMLSIVAGGRCIQAVFDGASAPPPLLVPLVRVGSVVPTAYTRGFDGGPAPPYSWLYFSIEWRERTDMPVRPVIVRTAPAGGHVAHFACSSRAQATQWMLGMHEALASAQTDAGPTEPDAVKGDESSKWTPGRILWQQVHVRLMAEASASGRRPMESLMRAVKAAAADWRHVQAQQRAYAAKQRTI